MGIIPFKDVRMTWVMFLKHTGLPGTTVIVQVCVNIKVASNKHFKMGSKSRARVPSQHCSVVDNVSTYEPGGQGPIPGQGTCPISEL